MLLVAYIPIHEVFDYLYAALQFGYSPLIATVQNQTSPPNGLRIAADQPYFTKLAEPWSSPTISQPDEPHKNDLLTKMEIILGTDQTISIWQFYLPVTTAEQMHSQTTRQDFTMQVNSCYLPMTSGSQSQARQTSFSGRK